MKILRFAYGNHCDFYATMLSIIYLKGFKMIALNKSTQILIDNFISTNFSSIPSENRAKIKNDFVEIADSILEQSN